MSLVTLNVGNMLLLSLVFLCFDELSEVRSVLLSILFSLRFDHATAAFVRSAPIILATI